MRSVVSRSGPRPSPAPAPHRPLTRRARAPVTRGKTPRGPGTLAAPTCRRGRSAGGVASDMPPMVLGGITSRVGPRRTMVREMGLGASIVDPDHSGVGDVSGQPPCTNHPAEAVEVADVADVDGSWCGRRLSPARFAAASGGQRMSVLKRACRRVGRRGRRTRWSFHAAHSMTGTDRARSAIGEHII